MITPEQLDDLEPGDQIETVPLFPTLNSEVVVMTCKGKAEEDTIFDVSWMGISIGQWRAFKKGGKVVWQV